MSPLTRFLLSITIIFSSIAAAPFSHPLSQPHMSTADVLQQLGGQPCFAGSAFTCVTVDVPLDHFNPGDTRTTKVTFAVLPTAGPRKGMFVTVTGGPGLSGVLSADWYTSRLDTGIPAAFDIVFFDQRGVGMSGGLACPYAAEHLYQFGGGGAQTPAQKASLKKVTQKFSKDCVDETGNPELLPYLGTAQAVEDLENFRQLIGDQKFWMYGESNGTSFVQTYAARHGDHLAGMILDGTVDPTLSGFDFYKNQAQGFNDTLLATFNACNADPACARNMDDDAAKAYDQLAGKLQEHPIPFKFPLPAGGYAKREFTFSNLEYVAGSQMYGEGDRMMFNRALAAYASREDLAPLARLLYFWLGLDPQTLELIPQYYFSDAVFYGAECQDYGYPGRTPDEKARNFFKAGDPVTASVPRLATVFYGDLPCAYWPNPTTNMTRPGYLSAPGVPTLVLGATADPSTPVGEGINVYKHLADGYLITQRGGPHIIFGHGNACPDALVTDFLVNDGMPAQRETVCDGVVTTDYVPLAPDRANDFRSPLKALASAETEIDYLPEYYYWGGGTPVSVGCTFGGTFAFEPAPTGANFTLTNCAFTGSFMMTGTGSYDPTTDTFSLKVDTAGRWQCSLDYTHSGDNKTIAGKCDDRSTSDHEQDQGHHKPDFEKHERPDDHR